MAEKRGLFTDKLIKNLKPAIKEYWKREGQGFSIRILPSGEKVWYYIYTFDGRKKFMRLGEGNYPDVSLAEARKQFDIAKVKVKNGIDPLAEKEEQKSARKNAYTVEDLISEYIEKHAMPNKKSWREDKRCLEKEVLPHWGSRKATDIKKRDVVLLLERIVERGSPVMANNTFEKIRKMFNFAVERDILEFTPCYGVRKPTKKEHKDRILTDAEIAIFWRGLDVAAMSDEVRRALKLILLTAQRPGEVIGMHSDEIDGKWWTIPAARAKNGKAHRMFLTETALEIIGEKKGYIFQSPKLDRDDPKAKPKSIHVNALAYAVRRSLHWPVADDSGKPLILKNGKQSTINKIGVEGWTPHDLRRTAATNLSALQFQDEIIDAVLNHTKKGVISIYNRYRYDREKQMSMEAWERKLKSILSGEKGNVIPLRKKK